MYLCELKFHSKYLLERKVIELNHKPFVLSFSATRHRRTQASILTDQPQLLKPVKVQVQMKHAIHHLLQLSSNYHFESNFTPLYRD